MAKSSYTAVFAVIDRVTAPLRKMQRAFKPIKMAFKDIGDASGKVASALGRIAAPLAAVFGVGGLGSVAAVGAKIVGTSAEFEKFQTVLETLEGSSSKAKASMDWVQDFAAKTPYDLAGVTDAFVKLKAYGIDPQSGALRSAGDAAAAMAKPLESAVEALADAMTGENERLKEFGITASTQGDKITYRWQENGKAMVAIADKNSKAMIQKTIEGIWNGRFGGAMDKLSGTWDGMWSNLQDTFTKFFKMIGDAGIFEVLKGELSGVLDTLNAMAADGSLKALAQTISDELVAAFRELKSWVTAVDWRAVWGDIKAVGSAVLSVVAAVGGLKGVAIIFAVLFGVQAVASIVSLGIALVTFGSLIMPVLASVGVAFKGLLIAMGPIGWAIAAIAAVGAVLYANWDTVGPWFAEMWEGIKVGAAALWSWLTDVFLNFTPLGLIINNWGVIGPWFAELWEGIKVGAAALWSWLTDVFLNFTPLGLIVNNWGTIGPWFAEMWASLQLAGEVFWSWISSAFLNYSPLGLIMKNWEPLVGYFSGLWDRVKDFIAPITDAAGAVGDFFSGDSEAPGAGGSPSPMRLPAAGRQSLDGQLTVEFANSPQGMKVTGGKTNQPGMAMEADVGYRSLAMP